MLGQFVVTHPVFTGTHEDPHTISKHMQALERVLHTLPLYGPRSLWGSELNILNVKIRLQENMFPTDGIKAEKI